MRIKETLFEGLVYLLPWARLDLQEGDWIPQKRWFAWGHLDTWRHSRRWYIFFALPSYSMRRAIHNDQYCMHQLILIFTAPLTGALLPNDGWRFEEMPL